jgi:TetR/AcrR family transcriptional repressor of nem operon
MAGSIRQLRGEATRTGILNVARRLFADFGYHNTGISDIQAATGLTKGAFYHHFPAKQDLVLAVLEAVEADYEAQLFGPAMAHDTAGRRLAALLDGFAQLNGQPQWRNCRLMVTLSAECKAADGPLAHRVQELQADMIGKVAQLIRAAQASGEAAPGSAEALAQLVVSTLLGVVLIGKTGAVRAECLEVISMLKRSILAGAGPSGVEDAEPFENPLRNVVRLPEDADYF